MRELPILMNTEMVKAILDGRKTQTRRPVKLIDFQKTEHPSLYNYAFRNRRSIWNEVTYARLIEKYTPYQIGDKLYVRESYKLGWADQEEPDLKPVYKADEGTDRECGIEMYDLRWKNLMPKEYARIWLEVTDVRVERVQDIHNNDAYKEGFYRKRHTNRLWDRHDFKMYWQKQYKNWDKNPWVWVYEFKVVKHDNN